MTNDRCIDGVRPGCSIASRPLDADSLLRVNACRAGQKDLLNALGLIVNMIVLRNTRYMEGVLMRLRSEGYRVWPKEGGGRRRRRKNIKILARRVGVRRAWRATPVVHRD
ncbi:hypothetical protein THIX_110096 [Thiomonas sp. X19]|nr:hypothetical protein THIX_110096 [Thiomonas sp. X19]